MREREQTQRNSATVRQFVEEYQITLLPVTSAS